MTKALKPDEPGSWGSELAQIWTSYLPPSRPSWSELVDIYTKYLRRLQSIRPKERLSLLVLGSTSEFRDWGYLENLRVTVIDHSTGYHHNIKQEMTYKHAPETFVHQRWQDMSFSDEFDIVVGDLVIGNLAREEMPPFLMRVNEALKSGGYFITKSFFQKDDFVPRSLEEVFIEYMEEYRHLHPFPITTYEVTIACTDPETGLLDFSYMYQEIKGLHRKGIIDRRTFDVYRSFGWQKSMKFKFLVPTISEWEGWASAQLTIVSREFGRDVYSPDFPVYVMTQK